MTWIRWWIKFFIVCWIFVTAVFHRGDKHIKLDQEMCCFGPPPVFKIFFLNYPPNGTCLNFTLLNLQVLEKSENVASLGLHSCRGWSWMPTTTCSWCCQPSSGGRGMLSSDSHSPPAHFCLYMVSFAYFLYLPNWHRYLRLWPYSGSFLKYVLKSGKHTHLYVPYKSE